MLLISHIVSYRQLSRLVQDVKNVHNVNVKERLLSPFVSGKERSHIINVTSEHRWGYVEYYAYVKDPQKRVVITSKIHLQAYTEVSVVTVPHRFFS
jgi:hypothetical protein